MPPKDELLTMALLAERLTEETRGPFLAAASELTTSLQPPCRLDVVASRPRRCRSWPPTRWVSTTRC